MTTSFLTANLLCRPLKHGCYHAIPTQGSSNNSQAPWKEINEDLDPILVNINVAYFAANTATQWGEKRERGDGRDFSLSGFCVGPIFLLQNKVTKKTWSK